MLKMPVIVVLQALFLVSAQVLLKIAMLRMPVYSFSRTYLKAALMNGWLWSALFPAVMATALWLYILRHLDFSVAYPVTSISYVFGMIFAVIVLQEAISPMRWVGVILIVAGVAMIVK